MQPVARDVLDFWLGDGLSLGWPSDDRSALWFGGGAALDTQIRERFGPWVERAMGGELVEWEADIFERLALVILLDQFSRNVYRGNAKAFAGDGRAQTLVRDSLAHGQDSGLPVVGRVFFYMPLMHAEDRALQERCVDTFDQLARQSPPELQTKLAGNIKSAREHAEIVARFGRFPHRNAVLGRHSTPEEELFLTHGPRFGQ